MYKEGDKKLLKMKRLITKIEVYSLAVNKLFFAK